MAEKPQSYYGTWINRQRSLLPGLDEELDPLTAKLEHLIIILDTLGLEAFVAPPSRGRGRPPDDRPAIARSFVAEAALMDLRDLHHNSGDGLHIASLAGGWLALVAGFGGMRVTADRLLFRPQLPPGWHRLQFSVRPRGMRLHVDITVGKVEYTLDGDEPIAVIHCSGRRETEVTVHPGKPTTRRWRPVKPLTPRPSQPPGREPHGV